MTLADARAVVAQRAQNANQPDQQQAPQTLAQQIELMKPEIARALPKHLDPERMARIALTLVRKNPDLAECTSQSFLGALMTCAQLGMEPGTTQEAYIIPRKGQAEFQLGYQGMVTLFYQHPLSQRLKVESVHEHDHFEHEEGLEPRLVHRPVKDRPRGKTVAYYAIAWMANGAVTWKVMYPAEIEERRKKSAGPNSPAWRNHYDEMAKKTVLRNLFKFIPKSADLSRALAHDGTIRTDADPDVIDVEPQWIPGEIVEDGAA